GIGTTLTANMLAMAALRAALAEVAAAAAHERMTRCCTQMADGLRGAIARHGLPWCVTQVGARCEFQFGARAPRNGSEAGALARPALEHLVHLALLNRDVMITPFHNMLLASPVTSDGDVARLLTAFDDVLAGLRA
ncbi:MAG: aspartate aminotransferase family protein, partial [Betaproteobacteria bacterium]